MQSHVRIVVIGGGVTGCSVLYHLAKAGWRDVVLLERKELTAGSSWHAAGGVFTVTSPSTVAAMHKYAFEIYPELERESGQACGFHHTGCLMLCRSEAEVESFRVLQSAVRRLGIESEFISLAEARERAPILNTDHLVGVLWAEQGGHVDPAGTTQAFAAAARKLGATIHRQCPVVETVALDDGRWRVVTEAGSIVAEKVVNAAGLWGREVAAMAGIELPLVPVEHHYLVTEPVPAIEAMRHELPLIEDGETNGYARQEGQGLLFGAYEDTCRHWAVDGTPLDFGHELLPDDLGRIERNIGKAMEIMPCLGEIGIKRVVNGPMIFSPDLGPLLGPHPQLTNYYCANGVMTGFNQGAGVGKLIAEWIIDGEPSVDAFCWDVARFGPWASKAYSRARTAYFYEHRADRQYPHQEYEAGRPTRTTPVHDRLTEAGAVFGSSFGLEHPLWYAGKGATARDDLTYRRANWFEPVARECRLIRDAVGLMEFSGLAKLEVRGAGAQSWLNQLLANRMPEYDGRIVLSPMLSEKGRLIGDFSVTRLGEARFFLLGSDIMQLAWLRHFRRYPPGEGVEVLNRSDELTGLHIAGPAARDLLGEIAHGDVGAESFPFMSARIMDIGRVPDVLVLRLSYTGDLGYELYCPPAYQRTLFEHLMEAGEPLGIGLVGTRALMMTRLEKSFPAWGLELSSDYTPLEAGVERFVRLDKPAFIGREAALRAIQRGPREVRVTFTVDVDDADAWGEEPIFRDGECVGYVSSGGYGAHVRESIALGYVRPDAVEPEAEYAIEILGEKRSARLHTTPLFDPQGSRMRA